MNTFKVYIDWGEGWNALHDWNGRDIVRASNFNKTETLHNNLDNVQDRANFTTDLVSSLANKLYTLPPYEEDGELRNPNIIRVDIREVTDDEEYAWFYGYIRPVTDYTINDEDNVIEFEALDNSWRLQRKPSQTLKDFAQFPDNTKIGEIIDKYLEDVGYSSFERSEIPDFLYDDEFELKEVRIEKNQDVRDTIAEILLATGCIFYFDAQGRFRVYNWIEENTDPELTFDETNIVGELQARRDDEKAGFDLDPANEWTQTDISVYEIAQDNGEILHTWSGETEVSRGYSTRFFHKGFGVDSSDYDNLDSIEPTKLTLTWKRWEPKGILGWFGRGEWTQRRESVSFPFSGTKSVSDFDIWDAEVFDDPDTGIPNRYAFRAESTRPEAVYLLKRKLEGNVYYYEEKEVDTVDLPTSLPEIKNIYIQDGTFAKNLAKGLQERAKNSVYQYELQSEEYAPLGTYVTLSSYDLNITATARVVEITTRFEDSIEFYEYTLEQVEPIEDIFTDITDYSGEARPTRRSDIEESVSKTKIGLNDDGGVSRPIKANQINDVDLDDDGEPLRFRPDETGLYILSNMIGFYEDEEDDWPLRLWNDDGVGKFHAGGADNKYIDWNGTELDIKGAATIDGTITAGDGIKSEDYSSGSEGWQINGDGDAEFNDVIIRGTLETGSIAGDLTLTDGAVIAGDVTLDSDGVDGPGFTLDSSGIDAVSGKIGGWNIESDRLSSDGDKIKLNADGSIVASDFEVDTDGKIQATGGTVGGWKLTDSVIQSDDETVRLTSNQRRLEIRDGSKNTKAAMGYLGGISGFSETEYGFYVAEGNEVRIEGGGNFTNGDYLIDADGAFVSQDSDGNDIVRLGALPFGEIGLDIGNLSFGNVVGGGGADSSYDETVGGGGASGTFGRTIGGGNAEFGSERGLLYKLSDNSLKFRGELSAATGTFSGELSAATGTFSGELEADSITAREVDYENVFAENITIQNSGVIQSGFNIDDGTPQDGGFWLQGDDGPGAYKFWFGDDTDYFRKEVDGAVQLRIVALEIETELVKVDGDLNVNATSDKDGDINLDGNIIVNSGSWIGRSDSQDDPNIEFENAGIEIGGGGVVINGNGPPSEGLLVKSGNVGIGVDSASAKLDVNGDLVVRQNAPMTRVETLSGSGDWTVPSGVYRIKVTLVGGGGAGGSNSTTNTEAGEKTDFGSYSAGGGAPGFDTNDIGGNEGRSAQYSFAADNGGNGGRAQDATNRAGDGKGGEIKIVAIECSPNDNFAYSVGSGGSGQDGGGDGADGTIILEY